MPLIPDKCRSFVEVHSMVDLLFESVAEQSQQLTNRETVVPTVLNRDNLKK